MPSEYRLHPASVIFAFLTQIRLFILPGLLVLVGASTRSDGWEAWQPWMMLLVVPNALFAILQFFTYRYRYDPGELVIRTGLLVRRERHIPYARIQNIDAVQHLLHRVLHVVEVRIETGGGQTPEATMSVLPLPALDEMRHRVFAGRHAAAPLADSVAPADVAAPASTPATLLRLPLRELLLFGFIENRGAVVIAAAFGVMWELGLMDRMMGAVFGGQVTGRSGIRALIRGLAGNAIVTPSSIALTLAAFAGLLLLVRVLSMGWAVVRLNGLTVTLAADELKSEYGLLTRVAATIPLRRIQSLTIAESPLHRLFARVSVRADTAGGHGSQGQRSERELLAPLLVRTRLPSFLADVLGPLDLSTLAWQTPAPGAFARELKVWLVLAAVLLIAAAWQIGWWSFWLVPLLVSWAYVGARQTVRGLGWAVTDDAVVFRRGWLWRRVTIVRFGKIQAITMGESPFDRKASMARVRVDVAGASDRSRIDLPYLWRETAVRLTGQLSREAAQRQFKW